MTPLRPRLVAAAATTILVAAALVAAASSASADTAPSNGAPSTVASDALPTAQVNGVVWTQVVIGNTVYAGGSFTKALPPSGASGSAITVTNLMAYNLSTGALISTFKPSFNGQIQSLAASADGKTLYAAGSFTKVGGATHNRVVALSPSTGAVVSGFTATANDTVYGLAVGANGLYLGGKFTSVDGATRTRAALVNPTTGALAAWAPSIGENFVRRLVVNDALGKIALAGSFQTIDGVTGAGFAIVDSSTGQTLTNTPIRSQVNDGSTTSAMYDVSSDGTSVYSVGYYSQQAPDKSGNLEGGFSVDWSTGATNWLEDCHGDSYGIQPFGDAVYVIGHPHYCYDVGGYPQTPNPVTYQRTLAFSKTATGTLKTNTIIQPRYYDFSGSASPTAPELVPDPGRRHLHGAGTGGLDASPPAASTCCSAASSRP